MGNRSVDRAIDEYAARQYGAFSYEQAAFCGASPSYIKDKLAVGAWLRLAPRVFVLASAPPRWQRQLAAAVLSRPGSLVAGLSAAYLHQLDGVRPGRPEVLVAYGANARSPIAVVHRSRHFDLIGRTRLDGFPVTNLAETLFFLSHRLPPERLELFLDAGLAQRRLSVDELAEVHVRHLGQRHPGATSFAALLAARSDDAYVPASTELERLLYRALEHPAIPEVVRQHPLPWPSVRPGRVDAYIPSWRLIVEGDGRPWHSRQEDFERDRERDNLAAAYGIAVLRFTFRMLKDEFERCRQLVITTGRRRENVA